MEDSEFAVNDLNSGHSFFYNLVRRHFAPNPLKLGLAFKIYYVIES